MARPLQGAIETFISITGATEAEAIQKLEEHGGDLNEAINSHFNEGDRQSVQGMHTQAYQNNYMDVDDPVDDDVLQPTLPLLSAAQRLNPFSVFESNFGRNFFDNVHGFPTGGPRVSHPREVREIPIDFKNGNNNPSSSRGGPTIEDVSGTITASGPETHGTITIDDEDDNVLESSGANTRSKYVETSGGASRGFSRQSIDMTDYSNDIEEEMIQAAIEASKRDVELKASSSHDDTKSSAPEDADLLRAVSLSLKFAEQKGTQPADGFHGKGQSSISFGPVENGRQEDVPSKPPISSVPIRAEIVSVEEEPEDVEGEPLSRRRPRLSSSRSREAGQAVDSLASSPEQNDVAFPPRHSGEVFPTEWGGLSSEEHDEAVMLEAAMFGGLTEVSVLHNFHYLPHGGQQSGSNQNSALYSSMNRPPSPSLTAHRLIREQQDGEYLASLLADQEKELKAMQDAEIRRKEEVASREAALERERYQEEEKHRKLREAEEFEEKLAAKQASLPPEPSLEDENAVTLLVRMPDGSRYNRRFLKLEKLQLLFDFIDVGRVVKPGTYRLVRPYPRRVFTDIEINLPLSELGLNSKQEALFLELIDPTGGSPEGRGGRSSS